MNYGLLSITDKKRAVKNAQCEKAKSRACLHGNAGQKTSFIHQQLFWGGGKHSDKEMKPFMVARDVQNITSCFPLSLGKCQG